MKRIFLFLFNFILLSFIFLIVPSIEPIFTEYYPSASDIMEELPGKSFYPEGNSLSGGDVHTIEFSEIQKLQVLKNYKMPNERGVYIMLTLCSYEPNNKGEYIRKTLKAPLTLKYQREGLRYYKLTSVEKTVDSDLEEVACSTGSYAKLPMFKESSIRILKDLYGRSLFLSTKSFRGPKKLTADILKDLNINTIKYSIEKRTAELNCSLIFFSNKTNSNEEDKFNITYKYDDTEKIWNILDITR